jgi:hypothetical protein
MEQLKDALAFALDLERDGSRAARSSAPTKAAK